MSYGSFIRNDVPVYVYVHVHVHFDVHVHVHVLVHFHFHCVDGVLLIKAQIFVCIVFVPLSRLFGFRPFSPPSSCLALPSAWPA